MSITQLHREPGELTLTVARRVRGLLAEMGMAQQDLAPILGISGSAVSKRLRGDMPFSLEELPTMASALNVSLEYLLGLTEVREAKNPRRSAPGGGSLFVLPETNSGVLRACRDSNPKPSDLYPATARARQRWGMDVVEIVETPALAPVLPFVRRETA